MPSTQTLSNVPIHPMSLQGKNILVISDESSLSSADESSQDTVSSGISQYLSTWGASVQIFNPEDPPHPNVDFTQTSAWMRHFTQQHQAVFGLCWIDTGTSALPNPHTSPHTSRLPIRSWIDRLTHTVAWIRAWNQRQVRTSPARLVFVHTCPTATDQTTDNMSHETIHEATDNMGYELYQASIRSMVRALALEFASIPIQVNCICVGSLEATALGTGQISDIAHAVGFLMADTGRWITGTTWCLDGGRSLGAASIPSYRIDREDR